MVWWQRTNHLPLLQLWEGPAAVAVEVLQGWWGQMFAPGWIAQGDRWDLALMQSPMLHSRYDPGGGLLLEGDAAGLVGAATWGGGAI